MQFFHIIKRHAFSKSVKFVQSQNFLIIINQMSIIELHFFKLPYFLFIICVIVDALLNVKDRFLFSIDVVVGDGLEASSRIVEEEPTGTRILDSWDSGLHRPWSIPSDRLWTAGGLVESRCYHVSFNFYLLLLLLL